jgi:two-component system cell cycle response regulator DivK
MFFCEVSMKTILQIEDNYANRRLVERILEPDGYRLLYAADGQTGIELALDEMPDLVLLDMGLPDMDGQTIVAVLRDSPGLENVPIVALTAWPEGIANEMAARYGCDGCITKPININEFPQQIATYLNR